MRPFAIRCMLLLALSLSYLSCERPLDLHILEPGQQLVLTSSFSNVEPLEVKISRGRSVLDTSDSLEVFGNANIELYANGNFVENLERHMVNVGQMDPFPVYRSSVIPQAGTTYAVNAQVPNFEIVNATSSIPEPIPINSLSIDSIATREDPQSGMTNLRFTIMVNFTDPVSQKDFYHLKVFQEVLRFEVEAGDTTITRSQRKEENFNFVLNNNMVVSFDGGLLFNDEQFTDEDINMSFNLSLSLDPTFEKLGITLVELRAASEDYYLYYTSLSRQLVHQNEPLTDPVILYNNIDNGLGIFAGYASQVDSTIVH